MLKLTVFPNVALAQLWDPRPGILRRRVELPPRGCEPMAGLGEALEALESDIQLQDTSPSRDLPSWLCRKRPGSLQVRRLQVCRQPIPTATRLRPPWGTREGVVSLPGVSRALLALIEAAAAAGAGAAAAGPGAAAAPEEGWEALRRLRLAVAGLGDAPVSAAGAGPGSPWSKAGGHGSRRGEDGNEGVAHRVVDTVLAIMGGLPETAGEAEDATPEDEGTGENGGTRELSGRGQAEGTARSRQAEGLGGTRTESGTQAPVGEGRTDGQPATPK